MAIQEISTPLVAVRVGARKLASRTGQPRRYVYVPRAIHLGPLEPSGAGPYKTLCGVTLTEENTDRDGRWADKEASLPDCRICIKSRNRLENPQRRRRGYPDTRDPKKRWQDRKPGPDAAAYAEERRRQKEQLRAFKRLVEAAEKEGRRLPQLGVTRRVSGGEFCYAVCSGGELLREFSGPRQKYPLAECLHFCSVWADTHDWNTALEPFFRREIAALPARDQTEVLDIDLEWE